MPADSTGSFALLHRFCSVVVLLTLIHIGVTLVYYFRSPDFSTNDFFPISKSRNRTKGSTQSSPVVGMKCPETSPLLTGPLNVEFGVTMTLEQVEKQHPEVVGGRWSPSNCLSLQRVAIIIPFRHREEHLRLWLHYLIPILQRQQLDYGVYVINQHGEGTFNRAKLLNVGFTEALKEYNYDCFVFSDVDIVPLDDRNIYGCFSQPRHLAVAMDKFGFRLPYQNFFGGVSSLSKEQFLKINGFPNNYWGWGGEDDDLFNRCAIKGMSLSRPSGNVGRVRMINHKRDTKNEPNPKRFTLKSNTGESMKTDGIHSLNYTVVQKEKLQLFIMISVDLGRH